MCKEVENLRIQLGIPEDESLFQLDAEVTESSCEIPQVYSMISDSEFTLPTEDANLTTEKELTSNIENKTSKNLKKNTSPDSEVSKLKNNKNKKFCCNFNAGRICKKKLGLLELLKKEDNFSSKAPVTLFENGQNCLDKSETSFGSIRNLKEEEDPIETSSYSSLELVEKIAAKISEDFTERNEVTENTPIDIKTAPEMLPCIIDDSSPSRIRKLRCVSFWNQHKSFLEESKSPCGDK